MRRRVVLLLAASGCRQVFGLEPPLVRDVDAAVADVADDAADAAAPACFDRWAAGPAFAAPTLITAVSTASYESDPSLTYDQLTMYFQRGMDIWVTTRSSLTAPWSAPVVETSLSSSATETKFTVARNNERGYLASNRAGTSGGMDIWRVSRMTTADAWSVNRLYVGMIDTASDQHDPHINADMLRIYYANTGPGSVGQQLMVASRVNTTTDFSPGVALAALNTAANEADPALTDDERVIVYTSTASGKRRIMYALRPDVSQPFGTPAEITALISGFEDGDAYITPDGCTLYISSTRTGMGDIYVTSLL